jgi:hypothetical protein
MFSVFGESSVILQLSSQICVSKYSKQGRVDISNLH